MSDRETLWIAPTGIRPFDPDAIHTTIPIGQLSRDGLSLTAIGLYGEVLSYQGVPIDALADAIDDPEEIRAAVHELVALGYLVEVAAPE